MKSLKEITFGSVLIADNKELCYVDSIDWKHIMKSKPCSTILQNNRQKQTCKAELKTCDNQFRASGCWGPGKSMCLPCKYYNVENECIGK